MVSGRIRETLDACVGHRPQRIDFVFGTGAAVAGASHDLRCGQIVSDDFAPNCTDKLNIERYSDHRLVWARFDSGT